MSSSPIAARFDMEMGFDEWQAIGTQWHALGLKRGWLGEEESLRIDGSQNSQRLADLAERLSRIDNTQSSPAPTQQSQCLFWDNDDTDSQPAASAQAIDSVLEMRRLESRPAASMSSHHAGEAHVLPPLVPAVATAVVTPTPVAALPRTSATPAGSEDLIMMSLTRRAASSAELETTPSPPRQAGKTFVKSPGQKTVGPRDIVEVTPYKHYLDDDGNPLETKRSRVWEGPDKDGWYSYFVVEGTSVF